MLMAAGEAIVAVRIFKKGYIRKNSRNSWIHEFIDIKTFDSHVKFNLHSDSLIWKFICWGFPMFWNFPKQKNRLKLYMDRIRRRDVKLFNYCLVSGFCFMLCMLVGGDFFLPCNLNLIKNWLKSMSKVTRDTMF